MPRIYHSPSSVALGQRCPHAWALCYLAGIREPEIAWADVNRDTPTRIRSKALGVAVHAVFEAWQTRQAVDWRGLPGQVALSGAHLIPHPDEAIAVQVERAIGDMPIPPAADHARPPTGMRVHGVLWSGYRDLLTWPTPGAAKRLGVLAEPMLVDYKSTSNIAKYALTPAELARDVQANLYGLDVCEYTGAPYAQARWLYLETKKTRRAQPVDVVIRRDDALAVLEAPSKLALELDTITDVASAPKNPLACGDYGGCPHHHSVGGPCDARRSIGGLIQARVGKKTNTMALDPAVKARFVALQNKSNGTTPPPAAPIAPTVATQPAQNEAPPDESAPAEAPPAPAPAAPRAPRGRPKATPAPAPAASPTGIVGAVLALQTELAAAEAEREAAQTKVDGVLARLCEALAAA